jgi:photosystem II stability/assembly factor-like uncharacterized protein
VKKAYLSVITVCILGGLYLANSGQPTLTRKDQDAGAPNSIGGDEDANERIEYETQLLRDPATGRIPAHIREKELAFAATLPQLESQPYFKTTSVTWQPRGPWNVGGRTRAFAIDISNENHLIAGSCSGGMWRSTDQGLTWTPSSLPGQNKSVSCLSQDTRPGHTNVWYYGTGEGYGASAGSTGSYYYGNGIYKSTDGGASWNVLPSTTSTSLTTFDVWADIIWNIATNPADTVNDVIFVAAYGGIYKSTNGGSTWALVLGFASAASYFTDIAVTKTGVVYATLSSDGPQRGIYRSTDGVTFTNITPASFASTYNRVKIGISPMDENQVYFLGNTPGFGQPDTSYVGDIEWNSLWKYKYTSGDGSGAGGIWNDLSGNLPTTGGPFDKFQCQGSYDLVVKIKPDDTNTIFIGGTNLYRSTSGFADNTHTTFIGGYKQGATLPVVDMYANHHPDQHDLVFFPSNPSKVISTNDGGIFMTTNSMASSVSWNPLNSGYLTSMFYTCAIDHATTNNIIIGGAQDNGSWYTNSASLTSPWVTPRGGDGSYCAIADYGSAYYFSIQNGKMMRAKLDAAGNKDSFVRIDPIGATGYQFINPFTLDPNNNNIMYMAGGRALWRNHNLSGIAYTGNYDSISTNWTKFPDSLAGTLKITAVAVSKTPANRVYYGTSSKRVFRLDNAHTGIPHPTEITSTIGLTNFPAANVSCIAVDPTNADNVMVVFSNYGVYSLYYSGNGGTSWSKVAGNLEAKANGTGEGPSCRWASIIPTAGGTVYLVGTSVGLFATTNLADTGTKWIQQGATTIGNSVVDMIDYRATDGLVVVATHSHGIFSAKISHVADINGIKEFTAVNSSLNFTCYPNPFSSDATVSFDLPHEAFVTVKIHDLMGREVAKVVHEKMTAGPKRYELNGAGLPSGTYYCTVKAGDMKETKQMLLLK